MSVLSPIKLTDGFCNHMKFASAVMNLSSNPLQQILWKFKFYTKVQSVNSNFVRLFQKGGKYGGGSKTKIFGTLPRLFKGIPIRLYFAAIWYSSKTNVN